MRRIKSLIAIVLVLFCINVKADDKCASDELARLKALAKKVEFSYDYKLEDSGAVFSISSANLNKDIKVLIIEDYYRDIYKEFVDKDKTSIGTLDGFHSGESVKITIQGYVPNRCSGKQLLTKIIKIPYYNYYYDDEKCKGNEEYKYCKLLLDENITEKKFDNGLAEFIKNKNKNNVVNEDTNQKPWRMVFIIAAIVFAIVIIIIIVKIIDKRRKKNSL